MTTVVLTPTHMASDHCVVRRIFPTAVNVDLDNQKIFISPSKTMMIGVSGALNPAEVNQEHIWKTLANILTFVLTEMAEKGLDSGGILIDDERIPMTQYSAVFDPVGTTLLITKQYRIAITGRGGSFYAKELGAYAGIGSGGMYAAGLCAGGMKIHDIWPAVRKYDPLSSVEHTVIPINTLKNMPKLKQAMRTMRDDAIGVKGAKK